MPAMYLALKSKFKRGGLSDSEAKTKAARIFNAQRPAGTPPVTKNYGKENSHGRNKKRPDRGSNSSEY